MWEATEVDNPQHQGVSFSSCLHGLFGKKEKWDSFQLKNGVVKKGTKDATYQFGHVIWEGKNKETIAIKSPVNRHYHGGEFLSKKVYLCGHAKKPDAPNLIVGACIKERPISAVEKTGGKKPFIAVLLAPDTLGFYWLNSRAQWEKTDEIKVENYRFDNIVYFSEDTNQAVTLISKTTNYKIIGHQNDSLDSPLKVPYLLQITISKNGKVNYNIQQNSATLDIQNLGGVMIKIKVNCYLAVSYNKNTLKALLGDFEILGFKNENFSNVQMPSITFDTKVYYVFFCCDTGKHCLTGIHYSYYNQGWPAPSYEMQPATLNGQTGIKGDFLSWKQTINGEEKKEITGSIIAIAEYDYGTAQWEDTWWDVWALANCDFQVLSPYIRNEVDGLLRSRYLSTLFGYSVFGSNIFLLSTSDDGVSNYLSRMQTLSDRGCVLSPMNEGSYVETEDGYLEARLEGQYNQVGTIVDRYKKRTYPANESRREIIVVIDLNNNLLITHNNKKLFIKKIINENAVEIIKEIPLNLSMAMTYEKVGFYQFDYGICGLFSTENIKYVSNKNGDYLLQIPTHPAILNGDLLEDVYTDLGVS